ncbi:hypothetical protein PG993_010750 [Apiospora rasikravindrae]|uniref:Uncharacterized protein n=1 Tax=Apiospora rasikravindrae TaxID=990691 RepID=A0ABR1SE08_9PEZI
MDSTPTRPTDWFYGSLNENEKSALDSMLRDDDEVLPTYSPEDSHIPFPAGTTDTIEWTSAINEPIFDLNCRPSASFGFTGWPKGIMSLVGGRFNMEASRSSFIGSPYDFYGTSFCPDNWSINFSSIENCPLDLIDDSSAQSLSEEAQNDHLIPEAIVYSPCGEHPVLGHPGQETMSCDKESNNLGKRAAHTLETPSQTQVLPKRRRLTSSAAPRKRKGSKKIDYSVEEVAWRSQTYRVLHRCNKPGQWKDFNGKVFDGEYFHTPDSEMSLKVRSGAGHMPLWVTWDKKKGRFQGEDIDGKTLVVDRDTMFAAVSKGAGSFVGDLIKD